MDYSCEFHLTKSDSMNFTELWADETLRDSIFLIFISAIVHSFSSFQILSLNNVPLKIRYGFSNSNALLLDTILGFSILPLIALVPYLIERVGRRKSFLFSISLNVITSCLLFFSQAVFNITGPGQITVFLSFLYSITNLVSISLGVNVMGIILIADLLPAGSKSVATQTLLLSTNVISIVVNFGFSILEPVLGASIHFPFIIGQGFCFYYCYYNLPETKGLAVYENFEQIKSLQNSCRNSLVGERSRRESILSYGSI